MQVPVCYKERPAGVFSALVHSLWKKCVGKLTWAKVHQLLTLPSKKKDSTEKRSLTVNIGSIQTVLKLILRLKM
jgi:hypothetical protein